jgi:hypothetical protein
MLHGQGYLQFLFFAVRPTYRARKTNFESWAQAEWDADLTVNWWLRIYQWTGANGLHPDRIVDRSVVRVLLLTYEHGILMCGRRKDGNRLSSGEGVRIWISRGVEGVHGIG